MKLNNIVRSLRSARLTLFPVPTNSTKVALWCVCERAFTVNTSAYLHVMQIGNCCNLGKELGTWFSQMWTEALRRCRRFIPYIAVTLCNVGKRAYWHFLECCSFEILHTAVCGDCHELCSCQGSLDLKLASCRTSHLSAVVASCGLASSLPLVDQTS